MTPFDPIALYAALRAFYPIPSPIAIACARGERPELFSAGEMIGANLDILELPDGRRFQLLTAGAWSCTQLRGPRETVAPRRR